MERKEKLCYLKLQPPTSKEFKLDQGLWKNVRKLDQFMFETRFVKEALSKAMSGREIGLFMLDCLVANQEANESGVGKNLIISKDQVLAGSAIMYQEEGVNYLTDVLTAAGLKVHLFFYFGDDDYKYSVDPSWAIENEEVKVAVDFQLGILTELALNLFSKSGVVVSSSSWLEQESYNPEIVEMRRLVLEALRALHSGKNLGLSDEIIGGVNSRIKDFVNWRTAVAGKEGVDLPQEHLDRLALEEMTSFAVQGGFVPTLIRQKFPRLPLIFLNTYPELNAQRADDYCVRLLFALKQDKADYGTIHLPGPERLAKFLKTAVVKKGGPPLTCGDPKGNPNWPKK